MKISKRSQEIITAYLFLFPALFLFAVFILIPILAIFFLSFTKYNVISPIEFIGWDNYKAFFNDHRIGLIFMNTIKFVVILVPLHVVIGLLLALGVTRKISAGLKYFYRTIFYFPVLVTTSAVAIAWLYIYNKDFGVMNYILGKVGIEAIPWMTSSSWVFLAIAIFSVWKFVGQPFIYYVIGLQNVPNTLLEAAEIDGANRRQKFFMVLLPMLSPTIFFVLVTTLIGAIQIFEEPFIITRGGPGDATRTLNLYIYEIAYQYHDMGYASTIALSLFFLILAITLVVFFIGKKMVHYNQE